MEPNRELKYAHEALDDTQIVLQKAENQVRSTNHSWEHEGKERLEFFQEVVNELGSIQQTYDLDSCPNRPSTDISNHIQLVDNPMFEVNADWTSDNPLFEISEETLFDSHDEDDLDFK